MFNAPFGHLILRSRLESLVNCHAFSTQHRLSFARLAFAPFAKLRDRPVMVPRSKAVVTQAATVRRSDERCSPLAPLAGVSAQIPP